MKKFLLSATVLGIFGAYTLHTKLGGDENPVVAINTSTSTPVATGAGPTPNSNPVQTSTPVPTARSTGKYKDGNYMGDPADAFYGTIQVQAVISEGRLTNVVFLQYPSDRSTSRMINAQADPMLAQEAIQAQSANVSGVSGATASSGAFVQSLQSALQQAM